MQFAFGTGNMYVTQLQDARGNVIQNPTPMPLMALQEGSIDFSGDVKELYGQNQFALAVGRGKVKLQSKVKPARIFAAVWNCLFFGQTLAQGLIANYSDTNGSVVPATIGVMSATCTGGTAYAVGDVIQPSTGAIAAGGSKSQFLVLAVTAGNPTSLQVLSSGNYTTAPTAAGATTLLANTFTNSVGTGTGATLTVTTAVNSVMASPPVNGTATAPAFNTFAADLGCQYALTGTPLQRVVGTPGIGQYVVNPATGQYTFSAADQGLTVFINFQYSTGSAFLANSTASNIVVRNLPMGYAPTFGANLTVAYQGKLTTMNFPMAISSKMSIGFKNEDFAVPEFDFQAVDNGSGIVLTLSTSE